MTRDCFNQCAEMCLVTFAHPESGPGFRAGRDAVHFGAGPVPHVLLRRCHRLLRALPRAFWHCNFMQVLSYAVGKRLRHQGMDAGLSARKAWGHSIGGLQISHLPGLKSEILGSLFYEHHRTAFCMRLFESRWQERSRVLGENTAK